MTGDPGSPLWQAAASFAARAHRDQLRKDRETPYAAHPTRVALIVACLFGVDDEEVLAAALLHDVIEDTGVDYDDLLEHFGKDVTRLVVCLSKDPRLVEPDRERAYDVQLAAGPWKARLIKLADCFDNLSEAVDIAAKRKLAEKARRAVALAENDEQLAGPRAIVERLVERVERELKE